MKHRWGVLGCCLTLLLVGGCGTIVDMANDQKIYGGTRFVAQRLTEDMNFGPCSSCGPIWILDLPLSLAGDTIVLPVTIILALTRSAPPAKTAEGK